MSRRRRKRSGSSGRYDDFDEYHSRRSRRGCLAPLYDVLHNVLVVLLLAGGSILFFVVVLLIAFNFTAFLQLLVYAFYIALGLGGLGVLYLAVRVIAGISQVISRASSARSSAKLERERVVQSQVQNQRAQNQAQLQQARLARDDYAPSQYQQYGAERGPSARTTRHFEEQPLVRLLPQPSPVPEPEPDPELIPGMPAKGQIFYYRDYQNQLKPGQLILGISRDGAPLIGNWADFKILLILGTSDGGKSNTIAEKCVCAVRMNGQLVVCDPHAEKPDSLSNRIAPLRGSLMPGTIMAMEHSDIMRNVQVVHSELECRRHGGSMKTPIFLVIEELNRLMRDKEIAKELTMLIEEMGQEARGYNIYIILCAQRVSGLAEIRNSVIAFICHRVNPMEAQKCIPARFAKYANELGKGQSFVMDGDGNIFPLQQVLIEAQDVAASVPRRPPPSQEPGRFSQPLQPRGAPYPSASLRPTLPVRPTQQQPVPGRVAPAQSQPAALPKAPLRPTRLQKPVASATWGEESPAGALQRPAPPPQQFHVPEPVTEDLARRPAPPGPAVPPVPVDPFDALAALREPRKKPKER